MSELKPTISYPDFAKLDIRVGTIVEAKEVENSDKLVKLLVDFGSEIGQRTTFAGIKSWYKVEELTGLQTIFLANLEAKKMPGGESQGMLLAAEEADDSKPILFLLNEAAANGARIL